MESRWIGQKLSEMGYRLTPQRLMILTSVEEADGHISAEEIYAQVRARYTQMNISTVYRTLELVKELGLVTETDLGDGRARYHCMGKGRYHHHLVCEKCREIIDMEESILSPLWADVQQKYKFRVNMKHLAIFGRCVNCNEK
ncbi:Fur family transcriptional regulator [Chloroflexota bacterium]